jgi:lipopolysaccharide export LptBFGC system permease protein LptF
MRDWIFAGLLAVAAVLITLGFARWSDALALIVAGLLLAVWTWLVFVFGEAGES